MRESGCVYLVGAGPGDAELLTLKALRALQTADVILYDALVTLEVLRCAGEKPEKIPVGKKGYGPSFKQGEINAMLVELAQQGKRVVRLKGGDPLIFSRAGEEIEAVRAAGIPVEIIPGITAAQAAATALGVPLTHRRHARRLQYITGHDQAGALPEGMDWRALADADATTLIYMAKKTLDALTARILAEGLSPDTPAAAVMDASRSTQRILTGTLATLPALLEEAHMEGPVTVVIGGVVSCYSEQ